MKALKYLTIFLLVLVGLLFFIPEKNHKVTTHQLAIEADINPKLAKFILHTKVGRKVGFLFIKKSAKKEMKEYQKSWATDTKE